MRIIINLAMLLLFSSGLMAVEVSCRSDLIQISSTTQSPSQIKAAIKKAFRDTFLLLDKSRLEKMHKALNKKGEKAPLPALGTMEAVQVRAVIDESRNIIKEKNLSKTIIAEIMGELLPELIDAKNKRGQKKRRVRKKRSKVKLPYREIPGDPDKYEISRVSYLYKTSRGHWILYGQTRMGTKVFHIEPYKLLYEGNKRVWGGFMFDDGQRFMSQEDGATRILSSFDSDESLTVKTKEHIEDEAFSKDGKIVALAVGLTGRSLLRFVSTETGKEVGQSVPILDIHDRYDLNAHKEFFWSDKYKWLEVFKADRELQVIDIINDKIVARINGLTPKNPNAPVNQPDFDRLEVSADGRFIAYLIEKHRLLVWDVDNNKLYREIGLPKMRDVTAIGFSHDNQELAVAFEGTNVRIWDFSKLDALDEEDLIDSLKPN